ncbi:diguanylate cyclase [Paenibacillus sp. JTLBN-2024]
MSEVGLSGRFGGEELVALIVDKRANPAQIAERIRARVAEETIVTLSIGYSSLRKNGTAEELVKQADQAMYRSKTTGKNKVSPYRTPSSKKNRRRKPAHEGNSNHEKFSGHRGITKRKLQKGA